MAVQNKQKMIRPLLAGLVTALGVFGLWWCCGSAQSVDRDIIPFDVSRDLAGIVAIVEDDWNWLMDSPDFPLEYILTEGVPTEREPHRAGELKTFVIRKGDDVVGFTSLHKKTEYLGRILFLAVGKDYRRQGYATRLLNFALSELKKMGMHKVELNTRKTNHRARSLYIKHGFKPAHEVGGHIYYYKDLDS